MDEFVFEIWHNPRCSKSRQALALLEERGVHPHVVRYLDQPPSQKRLDEVLKLLDMEPLELMRTKEARFGELGLGDADIGRAALIRAMADNPILIERPVVIAGDRAVLARPPERTLELLR